MGNCIISKFKGTYDNPDLEKFGVITLNVANASVFTSTFPGKRDLYAIDGEEATLNVLTDGCTIAVDSPDVKVSDTEALLKYGGRISFSGSTDIEAFAVQINNKYNLMKLSPLVDFDTASLRYLNKVTKIETVGLAGSINDLVNYCPELYDFLATVRTGSYLEISGKLSDLLGYCTNLTYFYIGTTKNTSVSTIEEAVAIRRAKGQTSNPGNGIRLTVYSGSITFGGNSLVGMVNKWLTWTPTTITLDGITIDA